MQESSNIEISPRLILDGSLLVMIDHDNIDWKV
jgi:hypothetical protein